MKDFLEFLPPFKTLVSQSLLPSRRLGNFKDCEALINDSQVDSFANVSKTSSPREKKSISYLKNSDDMQHIINSKILTQLQSLGKHLNSIEQNVVSSNVSKTKSQKTKRKTASAPVTLPPRHPVTQLPDLTSLRNDSSVQLLVEQRLKQLADAEKTGTKLKSLRGGCVEVLVSNASNGPTSMSCPGQVKKEQLMISCQSFSGWLAFVAS